MTFRELLERLHIARRNPDEPVVTPREKFVLAQAKRRKDRLERIVVAELGTELSVMSGKDVK